MYEFELESFHSDNINRSHSICLILVHVSYAGRRTPHPLTTPPFPTPIPLRYPVPLTTGLVLGATCGIIAMLLTYMGSQDMASFCTEHTGSAKPCKEFTAYTPFYIAAALYGFMDCMFQVVGGPCQPPNFTDLLSALATFTRASVACTLSLIWICASRRVVMH